MTPARVYLDYNATAPLRPVAREAMLAALERPWNASSVHQEGRAAKSALETAREQVAALVGADPRAVTFTSGATESIAIALSPEWELGGKTVRFDVLLISGVEHPATRAGGRFPADCIETIPVNGDGVVDLAALDAALVRHREAGRRALVAVMAANNETGVLQPINEIAKRVHAAGGMLHSDAVQIAGKLPFDLASSGADLISVASHKIGGPQGVGALIALSDDLRLPALMRGGGQERGLRAGTENVSAIVGFGAAAEEARQALNSEPSRLSALRDRAEEGLRAIAPETIVLSGGAERLPNTLCFAVPGVPADTAIIALDLEGLALSAGSACSSGKVAVSEVLKAMGVAPETARGAMRLSIGWDTDESDISHFLEVWKRVYLKLGRRRERAA